MTSRFRAIATWGTPFRQSFRPRKTIAASVPSGTASPSRAMPSAVMSPFCPALTIVTS